MPEKKLLGSSYFDQTHFSNDKHYLLNSILANTLAIFDYLETAVFNKGDDDRIVYSKNEYAFRARMKQMKGNENSDFQSNTLNMPFCNFGLSDLSLSNTRLTSPYYGKSEGIYIEELGKKIYCYPITINFEGCFYSTQASDAQIVTARLFKQAAAQTIINCPMYYRDVEIKNFTELSFTEISYDKKYTESDWLEQNRIHTVEFGISLNTYMLDADPGSYDEGSEESDDYWIVKHLIFKMGLTKNIDDWDGWTDDKKHEVYEAVVNHFEDGTGEVIWQTVNKRP